MKRPRIRLRLLFPLLSMFVLSACRDDGFEVQLIPVFPTASAEISPSGNTFKWLSNGSGKFS